MKGSRVLVTTRKESVAVGMESFQVFNLEKLSDEVCWSIISRVAFMGKDKDLCENSLEDVGKEIAKKCKGLPLAAKTLGGLLRGKRSKSEWENVLNSELWKQNFAQEYIFTPLLLSYYDLPSTIRPCLLYCVIFPKDYVMGKYELVTHWMAQGYLNSDDENVEMEILGEEYFNYLASRSFFQDFKRDGNGCVINCKMHDIVHDFVKFLVKDEISVEVDFKMLRLSALKVRHLNVIGGTHLPSIDGVEKLQSFVVNRHFLFLEELQNLVKGAKCLRLLEAERLRSSGILRLVAAALTVVPKEIGKLIHLRYLNLSNNNFRRLPEEVCELYNLQLLSVSHNGRLEKLPDGIGKLIQLRHLDTSVCRSLRYYPKGVAKLTSLRKLHPVIAKADKDPKRFSIGDLENLDCLREEHYMELIGGTLDTEEAKRAKLVNKKHLKVLTIYYEPFLVAAGELLEALNPPPNLTIELETSR